MQIETIFETGKKADLRRSQILEYMRQAPRSNFEDEVAT
jgi:hypothetical protein